MVAVGGKYLYSCPAADGGATLLQAGRKAWTTACLPCRRLCPGTRSTWAPPGGRRPPTGTNLPSLTCTDPADVLVLLQSPQGDAEPRARLVIAHQDAFAGDDGSDRLVRWLEDLAALPVPALPILLHGRLPGDQLTRYFRAGLFDALAMPLEQLDWVNMLIRAERRLELRHQGRLVLSAAGQSQGVLSPAAAAAGSGERALGRGAAQGPADPGHRQPPAHRCHGRAVAAVPLRARAEHGRQLGRGAAGDPAQPGRLRRRRRRGPDPALGPGRHPTPRARPGAGRSRPGTRCWSICRTRSTPRWPRASWRPGCSGSIRRPAAPTAAPAASSPCPWNTRTCRLGYLLLLFADPERRLAAADRYLPFLQAVQVVLSEEVAGAQMLDRIRDIGAFNARVLETVRSAIWVLDDGGRTVFGNRAAREMLTGPARRRPGPRRFPADRSGAAAGSNRWPRRRGCPNCSSTHAWTWTTTRARCRCSCADGPRACTGARGTSPATTASASRCWCRPA